MSDKAYRVAILTASDQGYAGTRPDESGPEIERLLKEYGYKPVASSLLPDDLEGLREQMFAWCQKGDIDLILTTGGTGFSHRDQMPEATLAVGERLVPGIPEAIRAYSMGFTKRAMFSRAVAVLCQNTLIVNLPGSPKAVREALTFLLPELPHSLDILKGDAANCAR